ncbi:regulator of (H+)-ATPase in vacuolar membrane [Thoreauomyces humboldtii]|nr:regulator of (H+)-ATPase in vacuolar membrane [Thoreauomyces humboldtii]
MSGIVPIRASKVSSSLDVVSVASSIVKAEFSPDGHFFATMGKSDHFPKVWYKTNMGDLSEGFPKYQFAYLPHPAAVNNFSWRRKANNRREIAENVLMTVSQGSVARLWCLVEPIQPYRFYLGAVIDPADIPAIDDNSTSDRRSGAVHWLAGEEIQNAISQREIEELRFSKGRSKRKPGSTLLRTRKLKEALKDYSDVLFHVQDDGSMVLWGVQYLTSQPRRSSKVIVLMRTEATVTASDADFFESEALIYHNKSGEKKSAFFFPAELSILTKRKDGTLHVYAMSLDDFFATSWMTPRLSLRHSWGGHRTSIIHVSRHPSLPLVASISRDGEVTLSKSTIPLTGLRTTDGLTAIASLQAKTSSPRFALAWFPNGPHFAMAHDNVLSIYTVSENRIHHLVEVPEYVNTGPLLLHAYVESTAGTSSEESTFIYLIGVSSTDATVTAWEFHFEGSNLKKQARISRSSLFGDFGVDPPLLLHALPTDDLCLIHYPHSPKSAHLFVTFSSDSIMRFWHCADGSLKSLSDAAQAETGNPGTDQPWRVVAEFECDDDTLNLIEVDALGKMATGKFNPVTDFKFEINVCLSSDFEGWVKHVIYLGKRSDWVGDETGMFDPISANVGSDFRYRNQIVSNNHRIVCLFIDAHRFLLEGLILRPRPYASIQLLDESLAINEVDPIPQQTFSLVDTKNGRLPDHHPQLLIQYLLWGKYDFVRYSLSLLHCFVKLMVDGGATITETPVPLWRIFGDDEPQGQRTQQYDALFDFGDETGQKELRVGEFSEDEASFLSEQLTRISLPNISNIDQMLLLAVIDTLVQVEKQKRSLDENGVRYVLFMRLFLFSQKSFPSMMKPVSLTSRDFAWGFFSDSQDMLLDFANQSFNNKVMWADAKALGMGYWLRNPDTMRRTLETIARNQYMGKDETRNPVDCALFYLALKKKNVLLGLWKLANSHPEQASMLKFLANDFEDERWKSAALKNAFALLGKQRYEYAVAFFLLADKLRDAVSVCLKQLKDPQLATILCRLYEGEEGPILTETYLNHILPTAISQGDRWMASMSFTILKQRDKALFALLNPLASLLPPAEDSDQSSIIEPSFSDPALLVFYHHLRRSYRVMRVPQPRIPADVECEFVYLSAQAYERLGLPGLALDIIRKADVLIGQYLGEEGSSGVGELHAPPSDDVAGGNLDMDSWGGSAAKSAAKPAGTMDWGAPVSQQPDTGGAADFDWSAPASTASEAKGAAAHDWGAPESPPVKATAVAHDWGAPESPPPKATAASHDWGAPESPPVKAKASAFDWGAPESPKVKATAGSIDWGEPTTSMASGGMDWGEPVGPKPGASSIDDEFEAFKKSLGGPAEPEEENEDGDLDGVESSAADASEDDIKGKAVVPVAPTDPASLLRFELEKRNMRLYMWMLAMRIVQAVYKSVSIVSRNRELLQVEATFRDYFSLLLGGVRSLLEIVDMPVAVMGRVLAMRCREMDAIVAYVELIPLQGHLKDYVPEVEGFLVEECNTLARLTLVCALRAQDYHALQLLVKSCDETFGVLLTGKPESITALLSQIAMPQRASEADAEGYGGDGDPDSGPDEDDFEENSPLRDHLQSEVATLCEKLIAVMSFQYIGLAFDGYLAQLSGENGSSSDTHGFLCDAVLRPTSVLLYDMQKAVAKQWVCGGVRTAKIRKYIDSAEKKRLWDTLKTTVSVNKLIDLIMQTREAPPPKPPGDDNDPFAPNEVSLTVDTTVESRQKPPELIYRTKDIIHTFAVNPLDHNHMAIGTHRGIWEVDIDSATHFFQRRGTFTDIHASVDDIALRATAARKSFERPSLTLNSEAPVPSLKRRDTLTRKLSFDSMQKAIQKNAESLRSEASMTELDAGQGVSHSVPGVSSLAAHPTLNYYLAGISDPPAVPAVVQLYQFGQPRELVTYTSGTTARFTRCRFDPFGVRFGASDSKGDVYLWRFDASSDASSPAMVLTCHSSFTNDFTFLNSSSLLATAGVSTNHQNVCLWDTLLPAAKSRVKGFNVAEGGAYSLVYSPRHQLLFSGGKKGDIYVFDTRQRTLVDSFQAHDHLVKSLAIDFDNGNLVSGSMGGDVKMWDLHTFKEQRTWSASGDHPVMSPATAAAAEKAGLTSYGVMQAEVVNSALYTCGADGCVRRYGK